MAQEDLSRLLEAINFAADRHQYQRRKDPSATPYINHPIRVAHILLSEAGVVDQVALVAAILHDTVEDTETTLAEIVERFGSEIASVVEEVTDDWALNKAARKNAQIENAPGLSASAQRVKLADKIANLRDLAFSPPADWSLERRREYFDWAQQVVERIPGKHIELRKLFDEAYRQKP